MAITLAVGDFARRVQTFQNRRTVPRQRRLDPVDLRDVQSQSDDQMRSWPLREPRYKIEDSRRRAIIPIIEMRRG